MNLHQKYTKEEDEKICEAINEHPDESSESVANTIYDALVEISKSVGRIPRTRRAISQRIVILKRKQTEASEDRIVKANENILDEQKICDALRVLKTALTQYKLLLKASKLREKELIDELRKLRSIRQAVEAYNR